MKIVVSGCSSSIGKKIIPILKKKGHSIIGLRRGRCEDGSSHDCQSVNLLNRDEISKVANLDGDLLILLAWETTPRTFWNDEVNYDWVDSSLRLVKLFKDNGGKKVLAIGTCAEYIWNSNSPLNENHETNPTTIYGKAKLATIEGIKSIGIDFIWARVFFMFCALESGGKLFADLIAACNEGKPLKLVTPHNILDFINVNEVADALYALIQAQASGIFNIGNGIGYSVEDVSKEFAKQLDSKASHLLPGFIEPKSFVVADIKKLESIYKGPLKKTLEELISEFIYERSSVLHD